MGNFFIKSAEDNCVYYFDETRNKWIKSCDIEEDNLPPSVKQQIKYIKDFAHAMETHIGE